MKIKVLNLQNEEIEINIKDLADISIEKDNGSFREIIIEDLEISIEDLLDYTDYIEDFCLDDYVDITEEGLQWK